MRTEALNLISQVTATEDTSLIVFHHFIDVLQAAGFSGSLTEQHNEEATEATWMYSAPKNAHPTESIRIVANVNTALRSLSFSLSILGERILDTDSSSEFISKFGNIYEYLRKGISSLLDADTAKASANFKLAHLQHSQVLSIVRYSYSPAQRQGMLEFLRDLNKAAKHVGTV